MSLIDQLNEELLKVVKLVFKDLGKEFSDQDNDLMSFDKTVKEWEVWEKSHKHSV